MPFSLGSILSFAGPVLGGLIGGDASQSAAQTQANSANQASQVQQNMFNTTQQNLAPYMQQGGVALSQLAQGLGLGPAPGPVTWQGQTFGSGQALQDALASDYTRITGNAPAAADIAAEKNIVAQATPVQGQQGSQYGALTQPFTPQQYQQSPGFQFQQQQGQQQLALQRASNRKSCAVHCEEPFPAKAAVKALPRRSGPLICPLWRRIRSEASMTVASFPPGRR